MQFELDIDIDSKGVKAIRDAGQCVTLIKPILSFVQSSRRAAPARRAKAADAASNVGWIVFQPFSSNTVQWTESYTGYATTTLPATGGVIPVRSTTSAPMSIGFVYTFSNGQFQVSQSSGANYVIANGTAGQVQLGLAQPAIVNDQDVLAPAVVTPVLSGQEVFFTPGTSVLLFLSSAQQSGTILPAVPTNALTVDCSSSTSVHVRFNNANNQFFVT